MVVEDIVGDSLRRIAKGAAIYFIGTIFGLGIGFVTRILVIRYLTPSEFGILSLSWVVFSIVCTIVALGIPEALTRQASYFIGKGEAEKAKAIFKISTYLLSVSGIASAFILFLFSNNIADFFKMKDLHWTLRIFSIAIPFAVTNALLLAVFRTYERADVKVIFGDVIPNLLKLIFITLIVLLGLSFYFVVWMYILPIILTWILLVIYSLNRIDFKTSEKTIKYVKILISFSIPLFIQTVLGMIIVWTDTLMIGYYLKSSDVGLYNGARPIANLMQNVLGAVGFLYFPIISQLYAQGKIKEIGRTYAVITKWLMSAILPVFLVILLFPKTVLWLLYSKDYVQAYQVLRILAVGFFVHVMLGPNGLTLLAMGETKIITVTGFVGAVLNFVMNMLFIPVMGINGAALASALTYAVTNAIVSLRLYCGYKIHPFTKNYIKPAVLSIAVAMLIYHAVRNVTLVWWMLIVLFVLFVVVYFISLLITRSFDREDIMLMLSIEQRLGLNLDWAKRFLRRFV